MTGIGLILGVSSARLGTMDMSITRLLSIHIPALLPPTSTELDVPHNIQVIFHVESVWQRERERKEITVVAREIAAPIVITHARTCNYTATVIAFISISKQSRLSAKTHKCLRKTRELKQ